MKSASSMPPHFGGVMQMARANEYRGKRVRLVAAIKAAGVSNWAGLWLRVDGPNGEVLAFDNMQVGARAFQGENGWSDHSVVLDVPNDSRALLYGLVLSGQGTAWIDDVRIEAVSADVPVTAKPTGIRTRAGTALRDTALPLPVNLDFEE